ncbi:uncharacterized protein I303_107351 [Kwoniella dejecticola CBS 10117]|uniref:HECT-type E3 ubiquitin transferase n=1 Tax=Kwoniella dejecticola CBS 10117 TaxID=1296121 RepID=A0AAJ8KVR2_9TREE
MKVKKSTRRHSQPPSDVSALANSIVKAAEGDLVPILQAFDSWKYPRGDLHTWVDVLDRFDAILAEVTKEYDLHKVQSNEFTPKTRDLVLEVLRVQRLLLENCTSRKLFSSYDYYPTKLQHNAEDSRIKVPAPQETPVRNRGTNPATTPASQINRPRHVTSSGPSTLDFGDVSAWSDSFDPFSTLCEENHVSLDDQYTAMNRIRIARIGDLATRRQLLAIRLMALATYVYISTDDAAQSGLFLYEPELVPQLAELLRASPAVGEIVSTGALHALDACAHHRVKMGEVLTAVSANVNHGILVTFFRNMVNRLSAGGELLNTIDPRLQSESIPNDLFDAAISFVAYIPNSPVHINMLMGAGILRLLLDVLGASGEKRESYIPRATGLIDSIIFASPQAMSNFSNADGVNTLVHCIKAEIETRERQKLPPSSETLSEEGLRNLVDSDLPKCLKRIFEEPTKFGTRVYAMGINIMATFVHNEPTSLSILQELHLPQTLYGQLESGIPASPEVINAVPTAIGAICLNQAGLDYTIAHPGVINNLVAIVDLPSHENVFQDRDNGKTLGAALDELSRHQPSLRAVIMTAIIQLLRRASEAAATFVPSEEEKREYHLEDMAATDVAETRSPPNNPHLSAFSRIFRVLNGLVRNAATAKDFINDGGLDYVLSLAESPCLPIRFGTTEAAASLSSLLRHIGEHDQARLVEIIRLSLQQAINECSMVWQGTQVTENWTSMDTGNMSPEAKHSFQVLRSVGFRLSFLSDAIFTLSFANSRYATSIISALMPDGDSFVANLGRIHRVAFQQHVLLKKAKPTPPDDSDPARNVKSAENADKDSGAKYLATRLHAVLTKFFKSEYIYTFMLADRPAIIKLIHVKRNPDAAHVKQAEALCDIISEIAVGHLDHVPDSSMSSTGIDGVALEVVTMLLFDNGRGTDGPLHTTLFLNLLKKDGLTRLVGSATRIIDRMEELATVPVEKRDQTQKDALVEATACVKTVLVLFGALASTKSLLENPETHALQQRPQNPLVAVDIFVKIRLAIFPLTHRIWLASWLLDCPTSIVKIAVRCYSSLIEGKSEEVHHTEEDTLAVSQINPRAPITNTVTRPAPVTADPARIDQLVDMGFSRTAAERALVRARNSIATATDMILSMPHMFEEPIPVPVAPVTAPSVPIEGVAAPEAPEETNIPISSEPEVNHAEEHAAASRADREAIQRLREEYRQELSSRALVILDHAEDLVFDLLPCFPSGEEGVKYLLDRLVEMSISYVASSDNAISARLRLIAVCLRRADGMLLNEDIVGKASEILSKLPSGQSDPRPKWLPALLLFAENVAASSHTITNAKLGDEAHDQISKPSPSFASVAPRLSTVCLELISDADVGRNELVSAMRLMATITRNHSLEQTDLIKLLKPFKQPTEKVASCHTLLLLVIRHVFEDHQTLLETFRKEIRHWLTPARNKVVDIQHFIKQLRQAALREPDIFVRVVQDECTLVDPTPPQSVYHIRAKDQPDEANKAPSAAQQSVDPFQESASHVRHPFIDHLVSELGQAVRSSIDETVDDSKDETKHVHAYVGLLSSILTELLGSYTSVKKYFMASLREQGLGTTKTHRGVASLINDLVCCVLLQPDVTGIPQFERGTRPARRLAVSSWAVSMVLALCSDIAPTATVKDVSEDTAQIRKSVLDAIAKVLRDQAAVGDPSVRYGNLWAIGELVYRLLMARPIASTRQISDATLHIAKTMLEKNYVGLLTNALGEIDLNYPNVRNVLVSLLKTLEHLTKTSVKWGKINKGSKGTSGDAPVEEDSSDSESESGSESDIDMMDEDQDAPDLYRNSALGMIGGELGDEDDDQDEDDEDEDDLDMGDDITDDDGDTDLQTSEDESMGSGIDADNWTDELEDGADDEGEEEMEQEVILGSNEDEEGGVWDDIPDDEESLGTEDNEMMEDEDDMDEEGEGESMIWFDGDDIDLIEPFTSGSRGGLNNRQSPEITGPWAWDQSGFPSGSQPRRSRSILAEDPTVSLFGRPTPQTSGQVAPHPLIADPSTSAPPMRGLSRSLGSNYNDLISAIEGMGGTEAVQMLESLITNRQMAGNEAIRIDFAQDHNGTIGLSVGGRTFALHPPQNRQTQSNNAEILIEFIPIPTMQRWQEGMQLATTARNELTSRLVIHVINHLMPDARQRAEAEAAKQQMAQEADVKAEAEEQTKNLAAAASVHLPESRAPSPDAQDIAMDEDINPEPVEPASESLARTLISIHGQDVDITDTGIDLEFLQALPEDMRADVVEQHMREQNRHRRPADSTDIPETAHQLNAEFLEALPPEIRAEVIMQEAMETARRSQPQPPRPSTDRVAAGFLAGLTNELRDVMLLNQPADLSGLGIGASSLYTGPLPSANKKPHREAVQLLEKPGIASLVRLLFFPETIKKSYLFRVLVNLCENTTTRSDLLNLLLSVVQDGSGDLPAVDRSFQQMSLKVMATPKPTPKGGQSLDSPAAAVVPTGLFSHLQTEHVPTFIAQRCFEALAYIVGINSSAANYFLTEHEQLVGLKRHPAKKGKGKEKILPQSKFPIVVLLDLLDRPLLAKTPGMMETVTSLLVTITKPLTEKTTDDKPAAKALQPIIPHSVLRLMVNCLTVGECTSRTFSSTLVAMQNLATLPEAKDVILQELRSRCKDLGSAVHTQLIELTMVLRDATTSEIGPTTLADFSPPTSSQAQLLRLLKTIDYLHLNKVDSDLPAKELTDEERAVSAVFESFQFETLWNQLGECLTSVEARGSTDQIATVLLPLVEALMVVSKYRTRLTRELRSPSAPPASASIEQDLFVSFTTTHRKVLNTIVRNNPSLLSGSFSLLIRNPRVLEFDNKRNWFFQKLKRKRDSHIPVGAIPLNIRRQYVFEDSFHALQRRSGDEIKYGKLSVKFYNEDGVDAGGVTREWYSVLAQQIFDPNFALFEPCAADQQTYQPNKASSVNGDHLAYFKFVGRVIGGRLLDAYFNRAFYKQILGRTVDTRDLESIDPEYHKSLQWMLDNDITGVIDQEFTIEDDQFGEKKIVELKPDGAATPVTEENKEDYVRLVVSYRLDNSIKDQIKAFLDGFYDIIPRQLIQIFEPDQLELLISGITTVDVDELKNATQLSGWKSSDPEISWFWRALRSFSQEERSRFLMFVTSSSRVPLGGFTQLQGSSGTQPFQIQKLYAKEGSLPQASTCFNLLLLPTYASYEQLREKLQFAIVETGGFGKA